MKKIYKMILFGILLWLIVFIIAMVIYPLHDNNRPFFEAIMPVGIAFFTVIFSILYLRELKVDLLKEGIVVGVVWLVINIIFDLFLFMEGPMKMSIGDYMMDIGFTYLMIPIITIGFGYILENRS